MEGFTDSQLSTSPRNLSQNLSWQWNKKGSAGWKMRDCSGKWWTDEPAFRIFEDHLQNSWSISILILTINKLINSCKHIAMLFKKQNKTKKKTLKQLGYLIEPEGQRCQEQQSCLSIHRMLMRNIVHITCQEKLNNRHSCLFICSQLS